ncbi:L,D-transpeptidase family protein [Lacticaseibacillus kribbianus]|uniref:L,D-transpeptidase family protein n=1 Tax=Lacticaseibacillus kribbianus TaxID=2926292 RepID=UPI001CD722A7|nr:L,D-transpeptidase family protein [Lacticaseibacillus kribbianus]
MKKQHAILIGLAAVAVVGAGAYAVRTHHYQTRFLPDTTVFGVAVGGRTVDAANTVVESHFKQVTYKLTEGGKTVATASGTQLGLKRDFKTQLKKLLAKQNPWGFRAVVLAGSEKTAMLAVSDNQQITTYAQALADKLNPSRKAPVDAKVVAQDDGYVIQPEVAGTQVSATRLAKAIEQAVTSNRSAVDVSTTYVAPKLTTKSKVLQEAKTKLQAIGQLKAVLTIQNHSVTIPTATLHKWLSYTDGAVKVSSTGVKTFIQSINAKYGTYTKTRQFKSTKRGTVSVPAGIYGWSIPSDTETPKVVAEILKGKDFTYALSHVGSGYHADGADIGGTYIEVDKVNQHEWYYKDGKLVMDTAVVTGKPSTPTPSGVFAIWSKQRNAILRGADYATPVSYWMPIDNTGVGLHDSSWQKQYGGDWYKDHGSHGCVNNPPSFIAKLYPVVALGTPVIVF